MGSPHKRLPAPLQTGKAPSREGKSSALPEGQETPLSQGSSWTVRFKELFHSGKRKAHVKIKSAGQRHGIPAPGARPSAPRAACSPQNPAASPPSVGTLAHAPALTSFLTEGSSSDRHRVGARAPSSPLCRIQSWISLPMPPKPHLEQSKRRYCWFSFPWLLCLQPLDPGPAALREEGCSCCPPWRWLKSDPTRKNISYRQQNQTKNKAAASEVPVPVPVRHLGAGGRRGREGSSWSRQRSESLCSIHAS